MTYKFEPVGWLIDEGTEHARMLLGSTLQSNKMGMHNALLVTLRDANKAVAGAAKMAEALDLIIRRLQASIDDSSRPDRWSMEAMVEKAKAALPAIAPDESTQAPPEALDDRRN